MRALETSIATDGWIGAVTVAADGETFDGSARVEKTAENGMLDDAIVIDSDGTKPIVVRRVDIPTALDERAVRLGLAANRIAGLNFDYDLDVLADIAESSIDLSWLYFPDELRAILEQTALVLPNPSPQKEPQLKSEVFIEMYCSAADFKDFRSTLDEWNVRKSVTVNIS